MRPPLQSMRRWLAILGVLCAAGAMAPSAEAHAFLLRSTPAAGARLADSPLALSLLFSQAVADEQISLSTADGTPVSMPAVSGVTQSNLVEVPLPSLGAGVYRVSWQVDSAEDSHATQGQFAFAIGAAGQLPATVQQSASPIAWPDAAVSWLLVVPLFLAFGGLASEWLIWDPVGRQHGTRIPGAPLNRLLGVALIASLGQLGLVLANFGIPARAGASQPTAGAFATPVAWFSLFIVGLIVGGLMWGRVPWMRRWILAPLGAALIFQVLRGHASDAANWWAVPSDALHVLVGALWIGGLGHLLLLLRSTRGGPAPAWLIAGSRRYATLALGLAALVLVSGLLVALAQIPAVSDLVTTSYGVILLVKLALVGAAVLAALVARRALPTSPGEGLGRIFRRVRAETALLALVLAAAAVLANAAPPLAASAAADLLEPPPIDGPALRQATLVDFLAVYTAATQDGLRVQVLTPSGDPATLTRLSVATRLSNGSATTLPTSSCGRGCADAALSWPSGSTDLVVDVASPDWGAGQGLFSVAWPLQPEDPSLVTLAVAATRAQPTVQLTERVSPAATGSVENTFTLTGEQFVAQEPYAGGGAADVHPVPSTDGLRALTLFLPGSFIWYEIEVDEQDRIVQETVVDPGHLLQRSLQYPDPG